jgi:phytoene dehydrogenase-like protein
MTTKSSSPSSAYDAIIIGAGHNGLVTASYLAMAGLSVLVLERRDIIGGGATTETLFPGFMASWCSQTVWGLQSKIIDELKLLDRGLEFADTALPRKSMMGIGVRGRIRIHPFPDGTYFGGPEVKDDADVIAQIREFSKHDAERYPDWLDFWQKAVSIFQPYVLTEPPSLHELTASVRGSRLEKVLETLITKSHMQLLQEYFEDEHTKAFVTEPGSHEMNPGSAGCMLCGVTFGAVASGSGNEYLGVVRGGMGAISNAIGRAARSHGAEIRTGASVTRVIVEKGAAVGVLLEDGEEIRSRIVVSNADPKRSFTTLFRLEDVGEATLKRVKRWKTNCGCLKFMAAIRELPDLSAYLGPDHDRDNIVGMKILPSVDYYQRSWDDAANGMATRYPVMGLQLPSVADPGLVSDSGHTLGAYIVFAAPHLAEGSWDDARQRAADCIIDTITSYAPNFRDSLLDWTLVTPADIESRVGMTDGNIRHLDMIPGQLLSDRQPYRTTIKSFYMCGAGTHPGGEVNGAPGHNAAHAILKDW